MSETSTPLKVHNALQRLQSILPLEANLIGLSNPATELYQDILTHYDQYGHLENLSLEDREEERRELAENGFIVADDASSINGAYPFTSENRIHRVQHDGITAHCMCALDALSVSPMFEHPGEVVSVCHVTNQPIHIQQDRLTVMNADENRDVYFGIEWGAACGTSSCADSLCGEMIFLKGQTTAEGWLSEQPQTREIFTLDEAIQFGSAFFKPLRTAN